MTLYYFLGTLLPELKIGEAPEICFDDFLSLLKQNLTARDYAAASLILRFIDIENIRQLWMGRKFEQKGNFDENELTEALLVQVGLSRYILRFLDQFDNISDRLKHFSSLTASFFREEIPGQTGFLKEWLVQERNIRLVLSAYRAKKMGRSLLEEMQHEDPEEPIIADILAQKDGSAYTPPLEFSRVSAIYEKYQDEPLELHKAFLEYRFKMAQEMVHLEVFTIDRIIAYLYQLFLAEQWMKLDEQKGRKIINNILGVA
jgi:hypothetical protein